MIRAYSTTWIDNQNKHHQRLYLQLSAKDSEEEIIEKIEDDLIMDVSFKELIEIEIQEYESPVTLYNAPPENT